MKKLLVLLTVAVGIFGFSTGAFAQLIDVCPPCEKCLVGSVPCPAGGQNSTATCTYFDYETGYGYISTTRGSGHCNAVFNICDCVNAGTSFVAGHRIGVRMTILVDMNPGQNGAYWSQPASANIKFSMFAYPAETCNAPVYTLSFGPGKFYQTNVNGTAGAEIDVTALAGGSTCEVGAGSQATMIVTNPNEGYIITGTDELNKLSRWIIDIPEIRIDPTVLYNGQKITVKIETLDQSTGGICADCAPTCMCYVNVAYVCPKAPTALSGNTCLFPYFTTLADPAYQNSWMNAIVLTNTSSTAGTVTLKVYQQDGATGTFTTPSIPANSQFISWLPNIEFVGTGLNGGGVYIQATSTFTGLDGYAFMMDWNGNSMGYLCRK